MNDIQKDYERMARGVPVETLPRIAHYAQDATVGACQGFIGTTKVIAQGLEASIMGVYAAKKDLPVNFSKIPKNIAGVTSATLSGITALTVEVGTATYAVYKILEAIVTN